MRKAEDTSANMEEKSSEEKKPPRYRTVNEERKGPRDKMTVTNVLERISDTEDTEKEIWS